MTAPLRLLLVEDNPDDELIISRELRKGGLTVATTRVESREAYQAALDAGGWDLIISDYNLPGFGGMEALALLNRSCHTTPFILVSGTVGEEVAVESIKAGADDYLLKQNLIRLVPAVNRVLQDSQNLRERLATERALEESRKRLELIFHTVSDFLVFLTRSGEDRWVYTSANRAFAAILQRVGYTLDPNSIIGQYADEVEAGVFGLDPTTCEWFREARRKAAQSHRPFRAERTLTLPGGTFVGEFTYTPIVDADGRCRHLLVDGRDVTDLRRAEEYERTARDQMTQVQKMESLGTLAGGIAHDFNNLLTGILGFAELVTLAVDLPDARQQGEQIVHAARRAGELVGRILTFARPQAVSRHKLFLAEVVREMLPLMRASFPKAVAVSDELPGVGPRVLADTTQLHQVILNLATNATHAMPGGGRLTLGVEEVELAEPIPADLRPLAPGPHAKLTVADTGSGMTADTLRRLFEPFFTTKPVGHGTGLGLSVVQGIVRDHQGAVRVRSELGRGSTFEVYLPTADGPRTPVPQVASPAGGQGEHVLCLDDDPALADLARDILTRLGYRATAFTDPAEAFAAFAADPDTFHAVVTDGRMPVWDGAEFARRVTERRPDLPVILVSGRFEPEDRTAMRALRRGEILAKPYTSAQLSQLLHRLLTTPAGAVCDVT